MKAPGDIPLLRHPLDQESAFRPEKLIDAVRAERGLADVGMPEVCVLDFDGDLTDWLAQTGRSTPVADWACYHTTLHLTRIDGISIGLVDRTIGGPYAVLIAEQMLAVGVRVIVGLTSAGRLTSSVPIPSLVVPTRALRDEGASYHYLAPSEYVAAPERISELLERELRRVGPPVLRGPLWTTDAPYRETAEQLRRHSEAGILAVEMQAASVFALAEVRGADIGVVAHVSNAADEEETAEFDKGPDLLSFDILRAVAKAGAARLAEDQR